MVSKIVVVGAGYAGIFLCTNLSSKLKDISEIILIDSVLLHDYFKSFFISVLILKM